MLVDWRSPPDEIVDEVSRLFGSRGRSLRRPLDGELSAKACLEALAMRVAETTTWRLGWVDQASDAFLVVRFRDERAAKTAVGAARLGILRPFALRRLGARPKERARQPRAVSNASWPALLRQVNAPNVHGLLISIAQDRNVREAVEARLSTVPKSHAPVVRALLALLDGREPRGTLEVLLEAVRFFSFAPSRLAETIEWLLVLAPRCSSTRTLRQFLVAARLPAFPEGAKALVAAQPMARRRELERLVARGLESVDTETLCAALDAAGQLGLTSLFDAIARHRASPNPLVKAAAARALRRSTR